MNIRSMRRRFPLARPKPYDRRQDRADANQEGQTMSEPHKYTDLLYDEHDGIASITINRPEKYNAFRGTTCDELIHAFNRAGWNKAIGVIVLSGAGTKAF